jgi:hypothetical protein
MELPAKKIQKCSQQFHSRLIHRQRSTAIPTTLCHFGLAHLLLGSERFHDLFRTFLTPQETSRRK